MDANLSTSGEFAPGLAAPTDGRCEGPFGGPSPAGIVGSAEPAESAEGPLIEGKGLEQTRDRLRDEIAQRRLAESLLAGEKRVLELIATGPFLQAALEALCKLVEEQCPGARCAIRIPADPEAGGAGEGSSDTQGPARNARRPLVIGSRAGAVGFPGDAHRRVIVKDVSTDPAWTRNRAAASARGIRACWFEPIIGSKGQVLGTLGIYFDQPRAAGELSESEISLAESATRLASIAVDRQRAQARAREQLSQLAHVARLATMGEMASGLAHELNQPLCAIVNFVEACLEMLESGTGGPEELRGIMADVARQAERAGKVINRLREFVRRREPQRNSVDVNRLVREVVELMKSEISRDEVRVRLGLANRLPPVLADEIQIQQVILNLVRNALQAMQEVERAKRVLRIRTARRGGEVEVTVRDSGCGVPDQLRDRVFEPFFSTKSHGMGMGLSISRSILEVHEGRLWTMPNPDRGTTFGFTLPIAGRTRQ